jgi:hypothetical protein
LRSGSAPDEKISAPYHENWTSQTPNRQTRKEIFVFFSFFAGKKEEMS